MCLVAPLRSRSAWRARTKMALQLALGVAGYRASQSPAVQPQALRSIPSGPSVAKRTESQAAPGVVITYFSHDTDTGEFWTDATASWQRKLISSKWARVDGPTGASRLMVPPTPNYVGNHCRYDHKCTNATSRCGFSWDDAAASAARSKYQGSQQPARPPTASGAHPLARGCSLGPRGEAPSPKARPGLRSATCAARTRRCHCV